MEYPEDYLNKIIQGDSLEIMKEIPDNSIDTIITDPPYGLSFMGKEWDNFGTDLQKYQEWTRQWAKEALRIAKPGATLLCFGGTRTWHRLACGLEDAGWIIKDTLIWLYGQGFPKSLNIGKAVDKLQGNKRKVVGKKITPSGQKYPEGYENNSELFTRASADLTKGTSEWEGWGTALKPAWEPIIMAMKPNEGSYAENALKYGVAGLNIDGGRIKFEDTPNPATNPKYRLENGYKLPARGQKSKGAVNFTSSKNETNSQGRFPANLLLECTCDEVIEGKEFVSGNFPEERGETAFFGLNKKHSHRVGQVKDKAIIHTNPECPCYMLDKQSGERKSAGNYKNIETAKKGGGIFGGGEVQNKYANETGGASRFFYVAKASRSERDMGLDDFEPQKVNDGRQTPIDNPFQRGETPRHNHHPTVKPLKLMEYLCILTKTPTGGIVLDPFAGSGTTCMAAKKVGRDFIGIEKELEYVKIAEARIKAIQKPLL